MALLDGFQLVELQDKVEDCYLTVTEKALKLNRATARTLGLPGMIRFYTNGKRLQVAVAPTNLDDENGIDFTFEETGRERPILIKEPHVLAAVKELVVLEKEGQNLSLQIKGLVYPEEKVIIFDLNEATESIVKPRGRRKQAEKG